MADVKPDAGNGGGGGETITLRVKDQTGEETLFKVSVDVCVCCGGGQVDYDGGLMVVVVVVCGLGQGGFEGGGGVTDSVAARLWQAVGVGASSCKLGPPIIHRPPFSLHGCPPPPPSPSPQSTNQHPQKNKNRQQVKKTTKMEKVMATYASRKGVNAESLRFLVDGQR
jgi:hypothetical protein